MKFGFLFFTILFSASIKAAQVPPEVEVERYLLEAERYLEKKAYKKAQKWVLKAKSLPAKKPDKYYFFLGTLSAQSGNTDEALSNLALYMNVAGQSGDYYQKAMDAILQLEGVPAAGQMNSAKKDGLLPGQPNSFVKLMKSKMISSSQTDTLQNYLNSLLKTNAVLNKTESEAIPEMYYKVYFNEEGRLIVTRNEKDQFGLQTNVDSLSVYGISAELGYDCSWQEQRCWVTYPQNNEGKQGRWLVISYAPHAIGELVDGMGLLIRELQK